jgi:urea transport system permease protein
VTVGLARSYLSEEFPEIWLYFLGGLFVGSVILFPNGIVGSLRQGLEWVAARLSGARPWMRGGNTTAPAGSSATSTGVVTTSE